MSTPAEYCKNCIFPFQQMGACPMPEKSIFWAYLSMLPYILPILILISSVIFRKFIQFKLFTLLASSYISGDKIVKNIIKNPRPLNSCKSSYGMPSSHMVVMCAFAFYRIRDRSASLYEKIFWFVVTIGQGYARIQLNYHTFQQVIAGIVYGVGYVLVFQKLWTLIIQPIVKRIQNYQQRELIHQRSQSQ